MNETTMVEEMVKIAEELDARGDRRRARIVDSMIQRFVRSAFVDEEGNFGDDVDEGLTTGAEEMTPGGPGLDYFDAEADESDPEMERFIQQRAAEYVRAGKGQLEAYRLAEVDWAEEKDEISANIGDARSDPEGGWLG